MADAILADVESSGIYQIRNLVNGKRYIGSAKCFRKRWHSHLYCLRNGKHSSKHMQNAWNKHGPELFAFEVIEICEFDLLISREQWWLDNFRPEYNVSPTAGSPLGVVHDQAFREKVSKRFAGKKLPPSQLERMRASGSAAWANQKKRERICAGIKASYDSNLLALRSKESLARWSDPEFRSGTVRRMREAYTDNRKKQISERNVAMWANPEFRAAMSIKQRGRVVSESQKEKIRIALTGKKMSVATRRKKSCLTDAQVVEILRRRRAGERHSDLASFFGVNIVTIARICRGERYQWVSAAA